MTNQIEEFRNQFVIGLVHWFILLDSCEGYFSKISSLILILWSMVFCFDYVRLSMRIAKQKIQSIK